MLSPAIGGPISRGKLCEGSAKYSLPLCLCASVVRLPVLFQRFAGALDACAGIPQRLRRGRVRDAEMRRQAERRALHSRHTLRLKKVGHEIIVVVDRLSLERLLADGACA